jgi:membrane protein DedA with SNARE-associated domain
MPTNPKKYGMSLILGSLVWALALVAAAYIFRGNPAKDWIESALVIGAITYLMWNYERRRRRRS